MRPLARLSVFRCRDPSPSSPLFHLTTWPGQKPDKLFPEQSARGPQLRRTTAGLLFGCNTKGRRRRDGRTRWRKWKDGPSLWAASYRLSNTPFANTAGIKRAWQGNAGSARILQHETSQLRLCASNTKAASRADGRGWADCYLCVLIG